MAKKKTKKKPEDKRSILISTIQVPTHLVELHLLLREVRTHPRDSRASMNALVCAVALSEHLWGERPGGYSLTTMRSMLRAEAR